MNVLSEKIMNLSMNFNNESITTQILSKLFKSYLTNK